jgi:hypothetical protein
MATSKNVTGQSDEDEIQVRGALARVVSAIMDKRRYVKSCRTYQAYGPTAGVVRDILLHLHEKSSHADMQSESVEVHVAKFLLRARSEGKQLVGPEGFQLFCKSQRCPFCLHNHNFQLS